MNSKLDFFAGSFGLKGSRKISAGGSGTAGETYLCVQAVVDTALSLTQDRGDTTINLTTLPAGVSIYGRFNSVSVSTGEVIAYIG